MKKIILFLFAFVIICFLIPFIFSSKFKIKETYSAEADNNEISSIEKTENNIENYTDIKLLHTSNNEIEQLKIEDYLCNVVSAEMPADFNNEALKAQAVVARTYTIYTIKKNQNKHGEADICDSSSCCQAWISKEDRFNKWDDNLEDEFWRKIVSAVDSTSGEIITYNGEAINAVYHANSGGKTEKASFVWEGRDYPYLQIVETMRRRKVQSV